MEKSSQLQLKTLQLTNVCLSDDAVNSFAKFLKSQTLEKLHISNRTEFIQHYGNSAAACYDQPTKIKDVAMAEFIKSLAPSAEESLKRLSLAHLKINSKANSEALG